MKVCISFIMIGLGIGWLAGLSLSPVISTIISALLALLASSMAVLTNLNFKKEDKVKAAGDWSNSIVFMSFLMLGIVVGSSAGVYIREHNILGVTGTEMTKSDIKSVKETLDKYINDEEKKVILLQTFIQQRILPLTSPLNSNPTQANSQSGGTVLYSHKEDFCQYLMNQGIQVIGVVDANRDDEDYRDLAILLDQLKNENLSDHEIAIETQKHLKENCS